MGFLARLFGRQPPPAQPVHIAPGRGFTFEITGEGHCQQALDALCGGKCEEGHKLQVLAQLNADESNAHDPNAVAVLINGQRVGWIPRDISATFKADLVRVNPQGRPMLCKAKVVGGWDRGDGDEGHYGVKLSLSQPLRLARDAR